MGLGKTTMEKDRPEFFSTIETYPRTRASDLESPGFQNVIKRANIERYRRVMNESRYAFFYHHENKKEKT